VQRNYLEGFAKLGVDLTVSTPEVFDALIKSDIDRFTRIFRKAYN
jgi:hypothetical protein